MGGQSMCPGETGTLNRNSKVTISGIVHRCGVNLNQQCVANNIINGQANFAVQIQNLSPTSKN